MVSTPLAAPADAAGTSDSTTPNSGLMISPCPSPAEVADASPQADCQLLPPTIGILLDKNPQVGLLRLN